MAVQNIFKCTGNEVEIIPDEILQELNISYEEGNKEALKMSILAKKLKDYNNKDYCSLPLCHTVEAESFGSTVAFNPDVGNRIIKYGIENIDQIPEMEKIDLKMGRIFEVLKAINILKKEGENIVLNITGPISVVTSILDSQLFYKSIRKEKEMINRLLSIIEDSIVELTLKAMEQEVNIISFADPTGTIDIVGPKVYKEMSGKSVYNILKRIEDNITGNTVVHLCGKTSTSLESIGLLDIERKKVEGKTYFEMIENIKKEEKDIKFIGHRCLKLNKAYGEMIICKLK